MGNTITDRNKQFQTEGLSQSQRPLPAFAPHYFSLYEENDQKFVRFIREFSSLISFFNLENKLQGSWKETLGKALFVQIESFLSIQPSHKQKAWGEHEKILKNSKNSRERSIAWISGLKLIGEILAAIEALRISIPVASSLRKSLEKLILERFKPIYEQSLQLANRTLGIPPEEPQKTGHQGTWPGITQALANIQLEGNRATIEDKDTQELIQIWGNLTSYWEYLRQICREHVQSYIQAGKLEPSLATLLAFSEVLGHLGTELNTLNRRHRDHFYQEILQMSPKLATPDSLYLVFELASNTRHHRLRKGTQVSAGQDKNGKERVFALERDIVLNHTRVARVNGILHDDELPPTAFFSNSESPVSNVFINSKAQDLRQLDNQGWESFCPGFAISAPILQIEPGNSLIVFQFFFESESFLDFKKTLFEEIGQLYGQSSSAPASEQLEQANKVLRHLLEVSYTSLDGETVTIAAENLAFRFKISEGKLTFNLLELELLMTPGDPAIAPCQNEEFQLATKMGNPLFTFRFMPAQLHFYDSFVKLQMERITVEVKVIGHSDLLLQNDWGVVDPTAPFELFGHHPRPGSNFYIGHPRIFSPYLRELSIDLNWFAIPGHPEGFRSHYKDYEQEVNNEDFKIALSFLSEKKWQPTGNKQVESLFQSIPNTSALRKTTRLDQVQFDPAFIRSLLKDQELQPYQGSSLSGFLKMELVSPWFAFGHDLYTDLVVRANTESILKKKYVPAPQVPYTPLVKSISLDYTSRFHFHFLQRKEQRDGAVYHIHPFGVNCLNDDFGLQTQYFFPHYGRGAQIFIAIENYSPGNPFSLLFVIDEEGSLDYDTPLQLSWTCLREDQWDALQPDEILLDTTRGFLQSGVIIFSLKQRPNPQKEILPNEFLWLRASSGTGQRLVNNLLDIHAHAVPAKRSSTNKEDIPLAAGSVTDLIPGNPNIVRVFQPLPSFGGQTAETIEAFQQRASERLRHKERPLTFRDIELVTLARFPELQKVICLSHLNSEYQISPGYLLLLVIPEMTSRDRRTLRVPRIHPRKLADIEFFLNSRTSHFTRIQVMNAALESVRVNISVKFRPEIEDIVYYKQKLNNDLHRFIMPWMYEAGLQIMPGKAIHAAQAIRFLDEQGYIDFVTNFSFFQFQDGKLQEPGPQGLSQQQAAPQNPGGILVALPQHHIEVVDDPGIERKGIGMLTTGIDFSIPDATTEIEDGIQKDAIARSFQIPANPKKNKKKINIHLKWE